MIRCTEATWFEADGHPEGYRRGQIFGTHWHGLFDNDDFRRQWLTEAASVSGRYGFVVADDVDVAARRDAQLDVMADLLDVHVDVDAVTALLDDGPPVGRRSPPHCAELITSVARLKAVQARAFVKTVPYCHHRRRIDGHQIDVAGTFPISTSFTIRTKTPARGLFHCNLLMCLRR